MIARLRFRLRWWRWWFTGPDTAHLNPGDPREDFMAAWSEYLKREPKQ